MSGFGARHGNSNTLLADTFSGRMNEEFRRMVDLGLYSPPVENNLVSSPSSSDDSLNDSYDDYLAMLQKGAQIGLFSTAQDVVNEAQKDRLFQSLEAEKERSWYEELSNTAYQRQVKDLESAGLNPILGFSNLGSGAASAHSAVPAGRSSGLSAVAPNLADYLNAGSNIISSASKMFSSVVDAIYKRRNLLSRFFD